MGSSVVVLSRSPFTAPLVQRTTDEIARAADRAMAAAVTPDWLLPRLTQALADGDPDAVEDYMALAERHHVALPAELSERVAAFRASRDGVVAGIRDCAACAYDTLTCRSLTLLASCALPFEMTPLGDLNALRRAGAALYAGTEVDPFDATLGAVGLAGTGLALVSGGTSLTVKTGATIARIARRIGTLTPALTRTVKEANGATRLAIASDLGRVAQTASPARGIRLMAHVDTAEDAARLARLSAATGPETGRVVTVLGKSRALRLTLRISHAALVAAALLYALAVQILMWLAMQCVRKGLRPLA